MKGMTIDTQMKTPDFLIQGKNKNIMNNQIYLSHCRKGFENHFSFEWFSKEHVTANKFQNVTNFNLRSLALIWTS